MIWRKIRNIRTKPPTEKNSKTHATIINGKVVPVIQISNLFNNEKDNKREPTVGVGLHRMLTTNRKQPNRLKDRNPER